MKNLITILIALHASLFTLHDASAQWGCACLEEGIIFNGQTEIDNFPSKFPGCNKILGDLIIYEWNLGELNLDSLSVLKSIGGSLEIYGDNPQYNSLNTLGLSNLTSIGGLYINRYSIPNLELQNLMKMTGSFSIEECFIMDMMFDKLDTIKGTVAFINNYELNLSGLDQSLYIGGGLFIYNNGVSAGCELQFIANYLHNPNGIVGIYNNGTECNCNSIIQLGSYLKEAFPCLPFGDYIISSQADIDSFNIVFPGCSVLNGNVRIRNEYSYSSITSMGGLIGITGIEKTLEISDRYFSPWTITSLEGLDNLQYVGKSLMIFKCMNLNDMEGLGNLTSIGQNLIIGDDFRPNGLISLTGLENLTHIDGALAIIGHCYLGSALRSLIGIENLNHVGSINIENNDHLKNLNGLQNLSTISGLHLRNNDSLINLTGLVNLSDIRGELTIYNNKSLIDLSGLENLKACGSLHIQFNDSLSDLSGLTNLEGSLWNLGISYNARLTGLIGLEKLDTVNNYLGIYNNPLLSYCSIKSICDKLVYQNDTLNIYIHDNAPGCNSLDEVKEACLGVGVDELSVVSQQSSVRVFPNPTSETVHFEFEIENPSPVCILVFNTVGEMVAVLSDGTLEKGKHQVTWNAADLPPGMYFCKVIAGKESAGLKLIRK